jgi:hypothetical protein
LATSHSVEDLWNQLWIRGFQNIYVVAIPEYTEVLAFTDDVRLFYDGADPMYCDACDGYLEGEWQYTVDGIECPHVIKGYGETLLRALEGIIVRQGAQLLDGV